MMEAAQAMKLVYEEIKKWKSLSTQPLVFIASPASFDWMWLKSLS